jgi:CubicO group peptidase (beta-lactamase class C family)
VRDKRAAALTRPRLAPDVTGTTREGTVHRLVRAVAGFVLLVAATAAALAQPLPTASPEAVGMSSARLARIGQVFGRYVDEGKLPGIVAMVARNGRLVYAQGLGFQDKPAGTPMHADAIFRAYSMTKPFVAVAAAILMEEGRLQLVDPVSKFLPEFAHLQVSVPGTDALGQPTYRLVPADRVPTVQDLLRHTAGLAYGEITANRLVRDAYVKAKLFSPDGDYDARALTPAEFVHALATAPLAYQPGTVWEYSLATDLLGRVVEAVSGQRLGDFLAERLFRPLHMADTAFYVPADKLGRLAQAFATDPATGQPVHLIDVSALPNQDSGGAGSVSTAGDYLRFGQMLLNGGRLDGTVILSPTTVALMTSDQLGTQFRRGMTPGGLLLGVPGYTFGLGFAVREQPGIAGLPGSQGEFMWGGYAGTYFWVEPRRQLVAVLMSQATGPTRPFYRRAFKQLVEQAILE